MLGKGDNDLAIKFFSVAIRDKGDDAQAYLYRGWAYHRKKDYDNAIKDNTEAIRLDPRNAVAYGRRGLAHDGKNDYGNAIKDFTEAIRLAPRDSKTYILRAAAHAKLRQNDKAVQDCDEAIHLEPKNPSSYVMRGVANADEREYEKAVENYTEALQLNANFFLAYQKRAWVLATCPREKLRDGEKALNDAKKACELSDWTSAHNLETLAAAYAEFGDFAEAVEWQKKALENQQYGKEEADEAQMRLTLYQDRIPYRELDRR